jgi:hypothetical protein
MSKVLREFDRPEIRVERTAYGMRLQTLRKLDEAKTHLRVTNILFPQAFVIPMSPEMTISQWHVPVDDYGCYWYSIFTSFGAPVDKDTMRAQRLKTYPAPDYKPIFSRENAWGFSADEQRSRTFTGMGFDINIHDQWACESQGRIQDRTKEHLGSTDKGIVLYRRILLDAIRKNQAGEKPPMVLDAQGAREITGPPAVDGIGPSDRLEQYWQDFDANRRKKSAWG